MLAVYLRPTMILRIVLSFCVLSLAACASPSPMVDGAVTDGPVHLAPGVSLRLPPPSALGQGIEAVQMVAASHGDDSFTFEGRLSVDGDVMALVTTDGLGRRAMTIRWDGRHLAVERADWLPATVPPPANMLADVMLIYWPVQALRTGLEGALLEQDDQSRRLVRDGVVLATVQPGRAGWTGVAALVNQVWDYRIDIASQQVAP